LTSRDGATSGTLPMGGSYTAAARALVTRLAEYVVTRFAGAQGPTAPDLFRELPYSAASSSTRVRLNIPFGQVNDFAEFANALTAYPGGRGPVAFLDDITVSAPLLPDAGRVITTGEKYHPAVQPPKPAVDGVSRYSLVELVTLALHAPCTASKPTLPADAVAHAPGYVVPSAAATGVAAIAASFTSAAAAAVGVRGASDTAPGFAPGSRPDDLAPSLKE